MSTEQRSFLARNRRPWGVDGVFSTEWEAMYQKGAQASVWPWSDLVSYVMRYGRPKGARFKILELGFGAGANIPFLLSLGAEYFGTEGSSTAVGRAIERFGNPKFHVACCDFTSEIPFDGPFDLVVDRSSLTHNGTISIQTCLRTLAGAMSPGAKFIGIDWFSTDHSDFPQGIEKEDYFTRAGFPGGQFHGVGCVHFSTKQHLSDLFANAGMELTVLEHKLNRAEIPDSGHTFASWNLVAEKRHE
jgi:hypothetical protein